MNSTTDTSGKKTTKTAPSTRDYTEVAVLNILASYIALNRWQQTKYPGTKLGKWELLANLSPELKAILLNYDSVQALVDSLITSGLMDVAASNSIDDVAQQTSDWEDFSLDRWGFQQATKDSESSLYACVKLKVRADWSQLASLTSQSECHLKFGLPPLAEKPSAGLFSSCLDEVDTTGPVQLYLDEFGYYVGIWRLAIEGHEVEVWVTYLHRASDFNETPNTDTIVSSHLTKKGFVDPRRMEEEAGSIKTKGFIIKPIRVNFDKPMEPMLGSSMGDKQIVGAQASGYLEFNENTALNCTLQSVVVMTTRGGGTSLNEDGYVEFYRKPEGRSWGEIYDYLIEVKVDRQLALYTRSHKE